MKFVTGLVFCFVLANFSYVSGLTEDVDILKELKLIKGQLSDVLRENRNLRKRTTDLERNARKLEIKVALLSEVNQDTSGYDTEHSLPKDNKSYHSYMENVNGGRQDNPTAASNKPKLPLDNSSQSISPELVNLHTPIKNRRLLLPTSTDTPTSSHQGISFAARVPSVISNVGDNQDIPFEHVETDTSQSFHGGTGTFTCPQDGVYAFFATLLTEPSIRVQFQIVKEGILFAAGYAYGDTSRYGTGSTSGIVRLKKGDKVWVRVHGNNHQGSGHMITATYSSFMGHSLTLDP